MEGGRRWAYRSRGDRAEKTQPGLCPGEKVHEWGEKLKIRNTKSGKNRLKVIKVSIFCFRTEGILKNVWSRFEIAGVKIMKQNLRSNTRFQWNGMVEIRDEMLWNTPHLLLLLCACLVFLFFIVFFSIS